MLATTIGWTPTDEEIRRHLPLVNRIVTAMIRRLPPSVLREDLVAAGLEGLLDALRRNGGATGAAFSQYARIRIRGAIVDELRAQDWLTRSMRSADDPVAVVRTEDLGDADQADSAIDPRRSDAEALFEAHERANLLAAAVAQLPPRERLVVQMRYFEGKVLSEIGAALAVSHPRVCQIHDRAMARLRTTVADE